MSTSTTTSQSSTTTTTGLAAPRLAMADTMRAALGSFRARRARTFLSALGIAIGIASLVAVTGLSASNRAFLLSELDELGTNLLTASGGRNFGGEQVTLPSDSAARVNRIAGVDEAATTREVADKVRRSDITSRGNAVGVKVLATQPTLLELLAGDVSAGRFLDTSTAQFDNVVLGAVAAERLGIERAGSRIQINDRWWTVLGVLEPLKLAPELDTGAFIGETAAATYFDANAVNFGQEPDKGVGAIYVRTDGGAVDDVRTVMAPTLMPTRPREVTVARPSDALAAAALADEASNALFIGLGLVALVVGGIGVANVMVIAVIERRGEIGLRRSLGATRAHIRRQFIVESIVLSLLGGAIGILVGSGVTAGWVNHQGWLLRIPPQMLAAAVGAALLVGAGAGLYPAVRAARLSPVDALRT